MSRRIVNNINELCIRVPIFEEDYRYYQCTKLMTTKSADVKFAYSRYCPTFGETIEILRELVQGQQEILDLIYWYLMYEVKISPQGYVVTEAHDWYYQCHKGYMQRNVISYLSACVVVYRIKKEGEAGFIPNQTNWTVQVQTRRQFVHNIELTKDMLSGSLIDPDVDEEDIEIWHIILDHVKLTIEEANSSSKRSMIRLFDFGVKVDSYVIGIQNAEEANVASMDWYNSPMWSKQNISYDSEDNQNVSNDNHLRRLQF